MRKPLLIAAISLMGYFAPVSAQTPKSSELETSYSEILRVVDLLREVGAPEPISKYESLGTRYKYKFEKPLFFEGKKYSDVYISYVDFINESDRIPVVFYESGLLHTHVHSYFDGKSGPIDGIPEEGSSGKYSSVKLAFKLATSRDGLDVFKKYMVKLTDDSQQQGYHHVIDQFLDIHKSYRTKIEYYPECVEEDK